MTIDMNPNPLPFPEQEITVTIASCLHLPEDRFSIEIIKTSGDRIQDRPLSEVGGTLDLEEA